MATALSHYPQSWQVPQPGCRVALVGFGTVGRSVARLLQSHHDEQLLRLTHVCNRHVERKKVNWVAPDVAWTDDMQEVVQSGADVVVELMGGLDPAHQLVRRSLQAGKSVVTANKQLIAKYGPGLQELASDHGQYLGFGACVAGGVPVLSGLHDGLAGDRIFRIRGILNGTCNYILTRMEEARIAFDSALAEAQCAGYAEADPTDDIDGLDAGAKLAILARVGLQADATLEQVICRSIRDIKAVDFDYARELGCTIRQISTAIVKGEKIYLAVEPSLVPLDSALAKVVGSQNLVVSTGEFGGDTVFGGCGAGGDPTAVAVVSDLLQAAHFRSSAEFGPRRVRTALREVTRDIEAPQYLRFVVRDRPGIIAALSSALARYDINLDAVVQKPGHSKSELPFVITLDSCAAAQLHASLAEISRFDFLMEAPVRMPLLKMGA